MNRLSVSSLSKAHQLQKNSVSISEEINSICKHTQEFRKRKMEKYYKVLAECVNFIKGKSFANETECLYEFDVILLSDDTDECLEFVMRKLREHLLDVAKVNSRTIFISWKFSELHNDYLKFSANSNDNVN